MLMTTALLLGSCAEKKQQSQCDGAEERFVDSVVARMDLKQQIGQLVQFTSSGNIDEMIDIARSGMMGSILNDVDPEHVNRLQKF